MLEIFIQPVLRGQYFIIMANIQIVDGYVKVDGKLYKNVELFSAIYEDYAANEDFIVGLTCLARTKSNVAKLLRGADIVTKSRTYAVGNKILDRKGNEVVDDNGNPLLATTEWTTNYIESVKLSKKVVERLAELGQEDFQID